MFGLVFWEFYEIFKIGFLGILETHSVPKILIVNDLFTMASASDLLSFYFVRGLSMSKSIF